MILFLLGFLFAMLVCLIIPPHDLFKKILILFFKTSENIRQKAAEAAEEKKD